MMQLNYERKMAVLMHKSDKILDLKRKAMRQENDNEIDDKIDDVKNIEDEDAIDCVNRDNMDTQNDDSRKNKNQSINKLQLLKNGKKSKISDNSQLNKNQNHIDIDLMISESNREADAIFKSILDSENKYENEIKIEETKNINENNQKLKPATSSNFSVEQFLRKKKVDKKKELDEASFCEYNPLDFMDWTSRSL